MFEFIKKVFYTPGKVDKPLSLPEKMKLTPPPPSKGSAVTPSVINITNTSCNDCKKYSKAMDALTSFEWDTINMGYDNETKEILVAEEGLMRVIMLANPAQEVRRIRLASREELRGNG